MKTDCTNSKFDEHGAAFTEYVVLVGVVVAIFTGVILTVLAQL